MTTRWLLLISLTTTACADGDQGIGVPGPVAELAFSASDPTSPRSNLYGVRLDGGGQRRLTNLDAVFRPVFSRDGSRLAFIGVLGADTGVYVMGADGRAARRVASYTVNDQVPPYGIGRLEFTPDGATLVYDQSGSVYRVPTDGSAAPTVVQSGAIAPAVAPSGTTLLYDALPPPDVYSVTNGIWARGLDSGAPWRVTTSGRDFGGRWSPDGTRIVFVSRRYSGNTQLVLQPASGGVETRVLSGSYDYSPFWSPTGERIAFVTNEAQYQYPCTGRGYLGSEIALVNADGSGRRRMSYGGGSVSNPSWSPDGRQLAYVVSTNDENCDIFRGVVHVADPGAQSLRTVSSGLDAGEVAWNPGRPAVP